MTDTITQTGSLQMPKTVKIVKARSEKGYTYVSRPSILGNPFMVGTHGNAYDCVTKYEDWLLGDLGAPMTVGSKTYTPRDVFEKLEALVETPVPDAELRIACPCNGAIHGGACHARVLKTMLEKLIARRDSDPEQEMPIVFYMAISLFSTLCNPEVTSHAYDAFTNHSQNPEIRIYESPDIWLDGRHVKESGTSLHSIAGNIFNADRVICRTGWGDARVVLGVMFRKSGLYEFTDHEVVRWYSAGNANAGMIEEWLKTWIVSYAMTEQQEAKILKLSSMEGWDRA